MTGNKDKEQTYESPLNLIPSSKISSMSVADYCESAAGQISDYATIGLHLHENLPNFLEDTIALALASKAPKETEAIVEYEFAFAYDPKDKNGKGYHTYATGVALIPKGKSEEKNG